MYYLKPVIFLKLKILILSLIQLLIAITQRINFPKVVSHYFILYLLHCVIINDNYEL